VGFGGVFDDFEIIPAGQLDDRIHIDWQTVDVDRHDGSGLGGDFFCELGDVHIPCGGVGINNDGDGPFFDDGGGTGNDGECRQDDLVAGAKPQSLDSDFEGGSAVADGDAEAAANFGSEFLLKFPDGRAFGGNPACANAVGEIFFFVAGQRWCVYSYEFHFICLILTIHRTFGQNRAG